MLRVWFPSVERCSSYLSDPVTLLRCRKIFCINWILSGYGLSWWPSMWACKGVSCSAGVWSLLQQQPSSLARWREARVGLVPSVSSPISYSEGHWRFGRNCGCADLFQSARFCAVQFAALLLECTQRDYVFIGNIPPCPWWLSLLWSLLFLMLLHLHFD